MHKNSKNLMIPFAVAVLVSLTVGIVSAAPVTQSINYQGKLTDAAGNPLTGTYSVTFNLYQISSGGTALATDIHSVTATKGLFTTQITADPSFFDGRALWLGIKVGSDPEMTPRQELRPVPYALSLRPGAWITSSDFTSALNLLNNGGGIALNVSTSGQWSDGVYASTSGTGSTGVSTSTSGPDSYGVRAYTLGQYSDGVYASTSGQYSNGVSAYTAGTGSRGVVVSTSNTSSDGVYVSTTGPSSDGVRAFTSGTDSDGVYARTSGQWSDGVYASTSGTSSDGVSTYTSGTSSDGVYARTSGQYSDGVSAYTTNASSDGVYAYTTGPNSYGVRASTSGQYSNGVRASTSGYGSNGVEAYTTNASSNGVRAFTSGPSSDGVYAQTSGTGSYGVYASTSGPSSDGVRAYTAGTDSPAIYGNSAKDIGVYGKGKAGGYFTTNQGGTYWWTDRRPAINVSTIYSVNPGIYVDTLQSGSPGAYSYTHGDNSQGFAATTSGSGSPGLNVYTMGTGSHGVDVTTSGANSYGVRAISDQNSAIYADTGRSDNSYGVETPDKMYAMSFDTTHIDVAEYFPVRGDPEPGTVLVIGADKTLQESSTAYDTRVAGIVSTDPGMSLGIRKEGNPGEAAVAVAGRVPCKVDAMHNPIHAGDLLTTSDTPGYAMKAEPVEIGGILIYRPGTTIGKAMESLETGTGTIEVLVTLQ